MIELITPPRNSPTLHRNKTGCCGVLFADLLPLYTTVCTCPKSVYRSYSSPLVFSSPSHTDHIVFFTNNIAGFAVWFEVGAWSEGGWELVLSQTLGWINKPGNIKRPFPRHLWTCALDCVNTHRDVYTQLVLTLCYTLRQFFLQCNCSTSLLFVCAGAQDGPKSKESIIERK